jgi:toxin CptA
MRSAPSIGFDYRPSRWPRRLLAMLGVLALVAIVDSGAGPYLALLMSIAVGAWVVVALRRGRSSIVRRATWRADGGWQLHLRDDSEVEARLLDARMVAGAIILRLGWPPRAREALLLFPDNLDAETRRRLRMRLSAGTDND